MQELSLSCGLTVRISFPRPLRRPFRVHCCPNVVDMKGIEPYRYCATPRFSRLRISCPLSCRPPFDVSQNGRPALINPMNLAKIALPVQKHLFMFFNQIKICHVRQLPCNG